MGIKRRKDLFSRVEVDGNTELDYLSSGFVYLEIDKYETFKVPSYMAGRPDIISYVHYGEPNYGWLILEYNDILDPWDEILSGTNLRIPSIKDYYNFYNKNKKS